MPLDTDEARRFSERQDSDAYPEPPPYQGEPSYYPNSRRQLEQLQAAESHASRGPLRRSLEDVLSWVHPAIGLGQLGGSVIEGLTGGPPDPFSGLPPGIRRPGDPDGAPRMLSGASLLFRFRV